MAIDPKKLQFWLKNKLNVLFEGKHGIGKTAIILQAFEKAGLKYAYFSGSTLDPFIDFVGVPVKIDIIEDAVPENIQKMVNNELVVERRHSEKGNVKSYIDLIRPKHLAGGDIQVIMIDEFNRTHKKVRNAVMELIQFGSINGTPLSKNKNQWHGIWAAINPDSGDEMGGVYDTDRLDPAQRDRFQIQIKLPYECDENYFIEKYGERNGKAAVQYWNELPEAVRELVSPRRLDYAMTHHGINGDVVDILPPQALPARLKATLHAGPAGARLQALFDANNQEEAKKMLADENDYNYVIKSILENQKFISFFLPLMPLEKMSVLYAKDRVVRKVVISDLKKHGAAGTQSPLMNPLREIAAAGTNAPVAAKLREVLDAVGQVVAPSGIEEYVSAQVTIGYENELKELVKEAMPQTYYRGKGYAKLQNLLPKDMTNDAALVALDILDKLGHSFQNTIQTTMPKYVAMVNHCYCCLIRNGMSFPEIEAHYKKYQKLAAYLRKSAAPTLRDLEHYVRANKSE